MRHIDFLLRATTKVLDMTIGILYQFKKKNRGRIILDRHVLAWIKLHD